MKSTAKQKYRVVDLFAGAGGLSYGFLQTGHFEIVAAFENDKNARKTYHQNHSSTKLYDDVARVFDATTREELGDVDVIIGGPPCQGFSNANRQKNHAVSQNNSLIKKYVHAVLHLDPAAFVLENVSMLKSNVHRFFVDKDDEAKIKEYGISTKDTEIQLLDSEHLFAGVEKIVMGTENIVQYLWNERDYLSLNVIFKTRKNAKKLIASLEKHEKKLLKIADMLVQKANVEHPIFDSAAQAGEAIKTYFTGKQTPKKAEILCNAIEASIMYQRMLSKAREIHDNQIIASFTIVENAGLVAKVSSMSVIDYIETILGSESKGYVISKGVLSAATFGVPQKRMRFVLVGVKKSRTGDISLPVGSLDEVEFHTVSDAIKDLENIDAVHDVKAGNIGVPLPKAKLENALALQLRDSKKLYNHVTTATTEVALERFKAIKQGENFHSLDDSLKTSYSDPTRTQNTIYLRLNYREPSGTVLNVRKSMWIHPVKNRSLTIREAARLQTFPDSFVFFGTKDSQYQQIGNAVPPMLAKAIAEHLHDYL
jgi:DNA (cytosine-5)-methyltransferase 1